MSKALGDVLRAAREKKGLTLEQLAGITKLNISFIDALEAGRRDLLPGNIYLKPFTKTCAEALDLDTKELYNIIDGETTNEKNNKVGNFELADPPQKARYKLPVVLGLAVIVIAVIIIAVKTKDSMNSGDTPEIIVPAETKTHLRNVKWSRPWEAPVLATAIVEEKTKAEKPLVKQTVTKQAKPDIVVAKKPIQVNNQAITQNQGILVLKADDSVYVRIFADGDMIFDTTMRRNEVQTFSAKSKMTITLDRNDCISGYLDGIKIKAIGTYPEKVDELVLFTGKDY